MISLGYKYPSLLTGSVYHNPKPKKQRKATTVTGTRKHIWECIHLHGAEQQVYSWDGAGSIDINLSFEISLFQLQQRTGAKVLLQVKAIFGNGEACFSQ